MNSTRIPPKTGLDTTSIDLAAIDVDEALQQGRRLRSQAVGSFFKALFHRFKGERGEHQGSLSPDCTVAA